MLAADNARLAIDANFDINGVDAIYSLGGTDTPCRVIPAQPDVEFGLDVARVQMAKSEFMVRASEISAPASGAVLTVCGTPYRINNAPAPDDLRLVWRLNCVKA